MAIAQTLNQLRVDQQFMRNVAAWERIPARKARSAPMPDALDPRLAQAQKS